MSETIDGYTAMLAERKRDHRVTLDAHTYKLLMQDKALLDRMEQLWCRDNPNAAESYRNHIGGIIF